MQFTEDVVSTHLEGSPFATLLAPRDVAYAIVALYLGMEMLANLDNSVRHAALADVPVTPRFGPASWRDFHVADRFLEAGRLAAEEQLPALRKLVAPRRGAVQHQPGGR